MKKNLNLLSRNFHDYKTSYSVFLFCLYGELSLLGNKFGILYSVLSFLPCLAWGILFLNDRSYTDL